MATEFILHKDANRLSVLAAIAAFLPKLAGDKAEGDKERSGLPEYYERGEQCHVDWYRGLWEQINGAGSWALNPWVWVVEFKKVSA